MRHDDIQPDRRDLALDFFYEFSRFVFALKENGYLVISPNDHHAMPNRDQFVSEMARTILPQPPRRP